MGMNMETKLRDFHQARWDEPIIYELSREGERGILIPEVDEVMRYPDEGLEEIPRELRREAPPTCQRWDR